MGVSFFQLLIKINFKYGTMYTKDCAINQLLYLSRHFQVKYAHKQHFQPNLLHKSVYKLNKNK